MKEIVKLLDESLKYQKHEIFDTVIYIHVVSNRIEAECKFYKTLSNRVHSYYNRSFQALPLLGKKVIIVLNNRKLFCDNPNCSKK